MFQLILENIIDEHLANAAKVKALKTKKYTNYD